MREEPKRLPGCVLLAGWCLHTLGEIAPVSCLRGAAGLGQDGPAKSLSLSDLTSQVVSKGEAFCASSVYMEPKERDFLSKVPLVQLRQCWWELHVVPNLMDCYSPASGMDDRSLSCSRKDLGHSCPWYSVWRERLG